MRTEEEPPILEGKYKLGLFGESATYPDTYGGASHHGDCGIYTVAGSATLSDSRSEKTSLSA